MNKFTEKGDVLNGTIGGKRKREPGQSVGIAQAGWVRPLMNVVVILFFFSFLGKFHSDGQEKGSFKHTNGRSASWMSVLW